MCDFDYLTPSLYAETLRVAVKAHRCHECYRQISIGERYQHVKGRWDGVFSTHKTCAHCVVAQQLLRTECGGAEFSTLQEEMLEHAVQAVPWAGHAARLAVGMRRQWQRFDQRGLMQVMTR